ncbi:integral membrane metal-binding DUF2296 family protein [Carpediemonas membranifera]|uniref:Endoplasmic reticulum junction formation protein lunapark n=1 Tax=Carpediemonas membranifera TaxID=201153 RepID=A0A8J6ARR1_9EUKA|nr:integral membrane metal-binding DUF2296 family protein [Carpediemonas membranifera]|eukprot:KAG9389745.1 integral membrane metal-binding DUF2296 family protein [Carpediemonas membranifera]
MLGEAGPFRFLRRKKHVKDILNDLETAAARVRQRQLRFLGIAHRFFMVTSLALMAITVIVSFVLFMHFPFHRMPEELTTGHIVGIFILFTLTAVVASFVVLFRVYIKLRTGISNYFDLKIQDYNDRMQATVNKLKETSSFYETLQLIKQYAPDEFSELPANIKMIVTSPSAPSPTEDVEPLMRVAPPPDTPIVGHGVVGKKGLFLRMMDAVVSSVVSDSPESRMALICGRCHSHNGLVPMEDFVNGEITYRCPVCHALNTTNGGTAVHEVDSFADDDLADEEVLSIMTDTTRGALSDTSRLTPTSPFT